MNLSRESRRLVDGFKMTTVQLRPLLEEGYTHLVISLPRQSDKVTLRRDTSLIIIVLVNTNICTCINV